MADHRAGLNEPEERLRWLEGLVADARDMLQRGDYADNERQRTRYRNWMEATRGI